LSYRSALNIRLEVCSAVNILMVFLNSTPWVDTGQGL